MVDCFDEVKVECDACTGYGLATFEFNHNRKTYEKDWKCPVCDGEGEIDIKSDIPNGKKERDGNKFFKIGKSVFSVARIEELVYVAEALQSKIITLVNQTKPDKPSLFIINDVELILMPAISYDEQNIAQVIDEHEKQYGL